MPRVVDVGGSSGFDPVKRWGMPENPGPNEFAAAKQWLADHADMLRPIGVSLGQWLMMLGGSTASSSKMTEGDVKAKIAAYGFVLADEPAYWFTADTLKAACKHFKWFPSVAELVEFLRGQCREREEQVSLAKRLADRGVMAELKRRAG